MTWYLHIRRYEEVVKLGLERTNSGSVIGSDLYPLLKAVIVKSTRNHPYAHCGTEVLRLFGLQIRYWIQDDITIYDDHDIWAEVDGHEVRRITGSVQAAIRDSSGNQYEPPPGDSQVQRSNSPLTIPFAWYCAHDLTYRLLGPLQGWFGEGAVE